MKYVLTFWLTILLCACGYSSKAEAQPWRTNWPSWAADEELRPFAEMSISWTWLVSGKITGVRDTPQETVVTIVIEEVYAGPAALQKRSFDARFSKDFSHAQFFTLDYLKKFAAGQRILTAVEWMNNANSPEGASLDYSRDSYGLPLPAIMDGTPQTQVLVEHANRVRNVYQAPTGKRATLLKQYAFGKYPITAIWATESIGSWSTKASNEILQQLAVEKKRSLLQLVAIEKILNISRESDEWNKSAKRLELLQRIATMEQGSRAGADSLEVLGMAGFQNLSSSYGSSQIVALLKKFVTNPMVSDKYRQLAVRYVAKNASPRGKISEADALDFTQFAQNIAK